MQRLNDVLENAHRTPIASSKTIEELLRDPNSTVRKELDAAQIVLAIRHHNLLMAQIDQAISAKNQALAEELSERLAELQRHDEGKYQMPLVQALNKATVGLPLPRAGSEDVVEVLADLLDEVEQLADVQNNLDQPEALDATNKILGEELVTARAQYAQNVVSQLSTAPVEMIIEQKEVKLTLSEEAQKKLTTVLSNPKTSAETLQRSPHVEEAINAQTKLEFDQSIEKQQRAKEQDPNVTINVKQTFVAANQVARKKIFEPKQQNIQMINVINVYREDYPDLNPRALALLSKLLLPILEQHSAAYQKIDSQHLDNMMLKTNNVALQSFINVMLNGTTSKLQTASDAQPDQADRNRFNPFMNSLQNVVRPNPGASAIRKPNEIDFRK